MPILKTLTKAQLDTLVREGDFPESVRMAAPKVVVIMTQDWCPQWMNMAAYLPDFSAAAEIFTVEYNRLPDFERIMRFKENTFQNQRGPELIDISSEHSAARKHKPKSRMPKSGTYGSVRSASLKLVFT